MRKVLVGAFLLAATASQASAQISFTTQLGAPDPGYVSATQALITDFTGPTYNNLGFSGSYSLLPGSVGGAAQPAPLNPPNAFFAVPNVNGSSNGSAIIDFASYLGAQTFTSLSFYWGSIDTYNTVELLGAGGATLYTVTGAQATAPQPANGNQTVQQTNRRIFFNGLGLANVTAMRLTSNGRAFEIDDIAGTTQRRSVVPEPTSLALLSAGMLGLVGVARRRRV